MNLTFGLAEIDPKQVAYFKIRLKYSLVQNYVINHFRSTLPVSKISHESVDYFYWNFQEILTQCATTTEYLLEAIQFKMATAAKGS